MGAGLAGPFGEPCPPPCVVGVVGEHWAHPGHGPGEVAPAGENPRGTALERDRLPLTPPRQQAGRLGLSKPSRPGQ